MPMQLRASLIAAGGNFLQILKPNNYKPAVPNKPCDIFINHRGTDTKGNISGLLYERLKNIIGLHPFLDKKSMGPGDKLPEEIDAAIRNCQIAVAVFSPNYCESYYCLHELALIMENKKRLVPIFWNVQPSGLKVKNIKKYNSDELLRFRSAIEKARSIVGLTFDSDKGDWPEFLSKVTEAVMRNLHEVEEEKKRSHKEEEEEIH